MAKTYENSKNSLLEILLDMILAHQGSTCTHTIWVPYLKINREKCHQSKIQ